MNLRLIMFCRSFLRRLAMGAAWAGLALLPAAGAAESTNNVALSSPLPLPDVGLSLLRVVGALVLVLALFLAGVWLLRNWQRLVLQRGRAPRLQVLEARSLGGRHALYVVGYEQERFLIASSPSGMNLLSHLQPADTEAEDAAVKPTGNGNGHGNGDGLGLAPSFARALSQMLKRR